MLKRIRKIFTPPVYPDPTKTRLAYDLNAIIISLFLGMLLWLWYPISYQKWIYFIVCVMILIFFVSQYILINKGYVTFVSKALPIFLWLSVILALTITGGVRSYITAALGVVTGVACYVQGNKTGFLFLLISIAAGGILLVVENIGLIPGYVPESNITALIFGGITIIQIGFLLSLANGKIRNFKNIAVTAKENSDHTITALKETRQELVQNSLILEQQNVKLEIAIELAQLGIVEDTENGLLDRVIEILVNKMNIDHVGIFLIDNLQENMVLIKSNSLGGNNLIAKNYSLKLINNPLITSANETEIIKLRLKNTALFLSRPITLPESKSNFSVAIATNEKLFGLLNLQSYSSDPSLTDNESVQAIANQVALALDNFRLKEELTIRIHELNHLAGDVTKTAWKEIARGKTIGYQYDHLHILPKQEVLPSEVRLELEAHKISRYRVAGVIPSARLLAPIILRDQVIGVIGYEDIDPAHEWSPSETTILETIASRVSLAIENSRLVSEAEQRAENELFVGHISSHIRETLDFETILQTALQDLQGNFDLHEAEIRLKNENSGSQESG